MNEQLLERDTELEVLRTAVRDAADARGQIVWIEGEAGIGKTELGVAARDVASEEGFTVLSARGSELENGFAFGIVLQLFGARVAKAKADERSRLLSGAAALAEPLFEASAAVAVGPEPAFPVLHGLYWLVANLCASGPVAIVVDDAHWADAASLRFLAFLYPRVEELPLLVVVASRPTAEWKDPDLGAHLATGVARLEPAPLSDAAIASVLESTLASAPDPAFINACRSATGGVAFYVHELAREVRDEQVARPDDIARLSPTAVTRAVLLRLGQLKAPAPEVAQTVSVAGDGADIDVVAHIAGLDPDEVRAAAATLRRAGILRDESGLAFRHPIVRSSVYADIDADAQGRMHTRAARFEMGRGASERGAAHLLAAPPAGSAEAVAVLHAVGSAAYGHGAPSEAVDYFRRALAEPASPEVRPLLLLELGAAELAAANPDALDHLADAAGAEDANIRALASLVRGSALVLSGRYLEGAETLRRAVEEAGGVDPALRLQLEVNLVGQFLTFRSTIATARTRLDELRARQLTGATWEERIALGQIAFDDMMQGRQLHDVVERAAAAVDMSTRPAPGMSYLAALPLSVAIFTDNTEIAERTLDDLAELAARDGSVTDFQAAALWRTYAKLRRGDLRACEAEATRFLELAREHGWAFGIDLIGIQLAQVAIERGNLDEADRLLALPDPSGGLEDSIFFDHARHERARVLIARGRAEEALALLMEFGPAHDEDFGRCPAELPWRSTAAVAALALGDAGRAAALATEDLEAAQTLGAPRPIGMALRALGLALDDEQHLVRAVETLEGSADRVELARALIDLGAHRRRADRRTQAREALERGTELASACGADALVERADRELGATGIRRRRAGTTGPAALTGSERKIAEMAARDMSNREIAQALFLTVKTVEVHLTHAYRKLGVTSRRELAAALTP